jgi:diacylglycerol kinase family enzyme
LRSRTRSRREGERRIRWLGRRPRTAVSYLVAIGGDATLSEAAAAAVGLSIPFVPVPGGGFGNFFTTAFARSHEPMSAWGAVSAIGYVGGICLAVAYELIALRSGC